jgi:acid phosphatase
MLSLSNLAIAEYQENSLDLTSTISKLPRPEHVVIVIEENKSYKQIIGNIEAPYINRLAKEGVLFTNSFAITHPSQPNYLALFSGSTLGVENNQCPILGVGENLASQLQKNGLSFGIYSESMDSIGFDECSSADHYYVRKHNPAVNWQGKNLRPDINMPFENFPSDYSKLPTVSIVIPNQLNNMHGTHTLPGSVVQGDFWLEKNLDAYVHWAKKNNSLLIVTWDEDNGSDNNHIPTIIIGQMVKPGKYKSHINHYNILRTIIDMFDLSPIGQSADTMSIVEIWKSAK